MSKITEMLGDGDFIAEQDCMHRTRGIVRVVDVQGIDPDQHSAGLDEIFRSALCKKRMAGHVCIRVPMLVPTCIHQHSLVLELQSTECVMIDHTCSVVDSPNNDAVQVCQRLEPKFGKILALRIPMERTVHVC